VAVVTRLFTNRLPVGAACRFLTVRIRVLLTAGCRRPAFADFLRRGVEIADLERLMAAEEVRV